MTVPRLSAIAPTTPTLASQTRSNIGAGEPSEGDDFETAAERLIEGVLQVRRRNFGLVAGRRAGIEILRHALNNRLAPRPPLGRRRRWIHRLAVCADDKRVRARKEHRRERRHDITLREPL